MLGWFFYPLMLEYVRSGEFTIKNKIKRAFIRNILYYVSMGVLGIIFLIYLWSQKLFDQYISY
jgi:hypothetical protein